MPKSSRPRHGPPSNQQPQPKHARATGARSIILLALFGEDYPGLRSSDWFPTMLPTTEWLRGGGWRCPRCVGRDGWREQRSLGVRGAGAVSVRRGRFHHARRPLRCGSRRRGYDQPEARRLALGISVCWGSAPTRRRGRCCTAIERRWPSGASACGGSRSTRTGRDEGVGGRPTPRRSSRSRRDQDPKGFGRCTHTSTSKDSLIPFMNAVEPGSDCPTDRVAAYGTVADHGDDTSGP